MEPIVEGVDTLLAWLTNGLKQTIDSYCDVQTADSPTTLVNHDGAMFSVVRIKGVTALVGQAEYQRIHDGLLQSFSSTMSRPGYSLQVVFNYNKDQVLEQIKSNFRPSRDSAEKIGLDLEDLFEERKQFMSRYCAAEDVFIVLYTELDALTKDQRKQAQKEKSAMMKKGKIPPFKYTQNILAAIPDLRDNHDSFVRTSLNDMRSLGIDVNLLDIHTAVYEMRRTADADFTDESWRPVLPGDKIKVKLAKQFRGDISDILWPSLSHQLIPRDAFNYDLKTSRVGDKIYSTVFIDLFPKQIQAFATLLSRTIPTEVPWRIAFSIKSGGMSSLRFKRALASLLAFSSAQNRLINDSVDLLDYIDINTDDAVVQLKVAACTWANSDDERSLRTRAALLSRAIQGWGSCDVSEICGDAFEGLVSTMLAISRENVATSTVASFSDVLYMLPLYRPSSPWMIGSMLFRTPDGKPWPYQPGSSKQTTWIDMVYARPGSGKSVLSNALNLALCLQGGLSRLPRISIIDIGPSSSGLISLLKAALPKEQSHLAAYHRLRMTPEYSINPFDTHLGCRAPFPQERSFLVNFVTLLATPVSSQVPYDGVADMAGMIVDEAYKAFSDNYKPNVYTQGLEEMIDAVLEEIGFVADDKTTWWEVVDALFMAGFLLEATRAQRNAIPLLSDLTSIARMPAVLDLYGKIVVPTGESLINSFVRMLSSAIREYPILARPTQFDLGNAKVVSLDLDEVAKTGGDAADRQTAVMYMLARYILAKDFYLNQESVKHLPENYREHHQTRVAEIREDHKRLVMDEFHRTSKAKAVRDQVIVDMREGRKWKIQIAVLSQSIEDFSSTMVDFSTSIFIMDAGPEQAIRKTASVFGLSETAQIALKQHVRGPREGGATFLAQFATKEGMNTQLLTLTLGPIELWAFTTTSEDVQIRNRLYTVIGPKEARRVLANVFSEGTATKYLMAKLNELKAKTGIIDDDQKTSMVNQVFEKILEEYKKNPNVRSLVG